jgi:hypothetical protein
LGVAAVAEGFVFGMFAAAPGDDFGGVNFGLDGGKFGAFVGAVAEGLGGRLAARAPKISAGDHFLDERNFLGNDWITHAV